MISQNILSKIRKHISKTIDSHPVYRHRHYTFVMQGNKIVGVGVNKICTHPLSNNRFKMLHSELAALITLDIPLPQINGKNYWLVNVRVLRNGKFSMSKPCKSCQMLIQEVGFSKVIYSDWEGKFVKL